MTIVDKLLRTKFASWVARRLPTHSRVFDLFDWFIPDQDRLVLFGAMNGQRYGDNSQYVYEWVLKNRPDIDPLWITMDEQVARTLKEQNKPVKKATHPLGFFALFRADVAMITNNFYDIALHPFFVPSSLQLINLTHGVPVKGSANNQKQRSSFEEAYKQKRTKLTRFKIVTSDFFVELSDEPVDHRITGYPRNDPLVNPPDPAKEYWMKYNNTGSPSFTFLYAPTWRHGREETTFFPFDDFDIKELDRVLHRMDAQLLLRPHRNELRIYDSMREKLEDYAAQCDQIRLATHDEFADVNSLLAFVDCLITDYSGIYHDYLLLDRPIIFIPYDYKDYEHHNGFRYDFFEHLPGPAIYDFGEFITALGRAVGDEAVYREERQALKKKIHRYDDAESTRRVIELLDELLPEKTS